VRGVGGGKREYTAFIWLEMRYSAAITEKDDKLAQAILLHVSAPVSHIQGFSYTKEFWLSLRK